MNTPERPYQPAHLPNSVAGARQRSAHYEDALAQAISADLDSALVVARDAIAQLAERHQHVVEVTDLDLGLAAGNRYLALWEATAAAIGLASALRELVVLGYHAQTMPTYRALHEILGVVSVLSDEQEEAFLASWLANGEVRPREVRAAASRTAQRLRDRLAATGLTDEVADPSIFMRGLYGPLSDSSHGRREAVREYLSEDLRLALSGPHPAASIRIHFVENFLQLVLEVVLVVGLALAGLYGGSFYAERIAPVQARVASAIDTLAALRVRIERS
jgi:hypothetical protein